jgi:hypothetical protein
VNVALGRYGLGRRGERLADDLSAEDGSPAEILAWPSERVVSRSLERKQRDELVENA